MARSYRKNYVDSSGEIQEKFIIKILCGWDFTTTSKPAAELKQKHLFKEYQVWNIHVFFSHN